MTLYDGWKPTKDENPNFVCVKCKSNNIYYRYWESHDGAHEDINYHCHNCDRSWWVEGSDY
jgi:DNA-directed RNA polymerase subunit M/transcription elongation factor TFIIS